MGRPSGGRGCTIVPRTQTLERLLLSPLLNNATRAFRSDIHAACNADLGTLGNDLCKKIPTGSRCALSRDEMPKLDAKSSSTSRPVRIFTHLPWWPGTHFSGK